MIKLLLTLVLLLFSFNIYSSNFTIAEDAFEFNVRKLDKKSSMSAFQLNTSINQNSRLTIHEDGHIYSNNQRIRLFGTNLLNIPTKEKAKENAEFLASLGINCVRFHQLDASWSQIFLQKNKDGSYSFNSNKMDEFDFFFAELKKVGIYSDINLLVARDYSSVDGLPKSIDKIKDWKNRHCYGFWNTDARNLQKQFASQLLTHINPYTKQTYLEDPAVAIVEIINENGLLLSYTGKMLDEYDDILWNELQDKWNIWLRTKKLDYEQLINNYDPKTKLVKNIVILPRFEEYKKYSENFQMLVMNFLYDTEKEYWSDMNNFLRNELKIKSLLMGTIIGASTHKLQDFFDIIDIHVYWTPPLFLNDDWDSSNFYVNNKSLASSIQGGALTTAAENRVYGKPFSVSEYDHTFPNQYTAEMYPMLSSFAAFQDWDCIFSYCGNYISTDESKNRKIRNYFDQIQNPTKAGALPLAARIFRNFMVSPGKYKVYANVSEQIELQNLHKMKDWFQGYGRYYNLHKIYGLRNQIGIALDGKIPENGIEVSLLPTEDTVIKEVQDSGIYSDTDELFWDPINSSFFVSNDNLSIFVLSQNSKRSIHNQWLEKSPILSLKNISDFSSFVACKEKDYYLVFACSWAGNKGEQLRELGTQNNSDNFLIYRKPIKLTTNKDFGEGPAYTLSCDGTIEINNEIIKGCEIYKINQEGYEDLMSKDNNLTLRKDSNTIWYKLVPQF